MSKDETIVALIQHIRELSWIVANAAKAADLDTGASTTINQAIGALLPAETAIADIAATMATIRSLRRR